MEGRIVPYIMRILCWNVQRINNVGKYNELKAYVHNFFVGLVSLLETKVKATNISSLYYKMLNG